MPDVEPCARCGNTGLIDLPTPSRSEAKRRRRSGEPDYRQKICPSCGGASNPSLQVMLDQEAAERAAAEAARQRQGQDRHRQLAAKRKRERAARRKARRR